MQCGLRVCGAQVLRTYAEQFGVGQGAPGEPPANVPSTPVGATSFEERLERLATLQSEAMLKALGKKKKVSVPASPAFLACACLHAFVIAARFWWRWTSSWNWIIWGCPSGLHLSSGQRVTLYASWRRNSERSVVVLSCFRLRLHQLSPQARGAPADHRCSRLRHRALCI